MTTASATFLAWPVGSPVPAILIKDKAGTEGPVNYAVRGDVIVIDGVPRELILRSGKDMATLENNGPRPALLRRWPGSMRSSNEAGDAPGGQGRP